MRITKEDLARRWLAATLAGAAVYAVISLIDLQLKMRSGFGVSDLPGFSRAGQYGAAAFVWGQSGYGLRAGLVLGLQYLLMPLYALSFFFSGILAREAFTPRPGRARRLLTLLAAVPIAGALLNAVENGLDLALLLTPPGDGLAAIAHMLAAARQGAMIVGLLLLVGAVLARVAERRSRRRPPEGLKG